MRSVVCGLLSDVVQVQGTSIAAVLENRKSKYFLLTVSEKSEPALLILTKKNLVLVCDAA